AVYAPSSRAISLRSTDRGCDAFKPVHARNRWIQVRVCNDSRCEACRSEPQAGVAAGDTVERCELGGALDRLTVEADAVEGSAVCEDVSAEERFGEARVVDHESADRGQLVVAWRVGGAEVGSAVEVADGQG